MEFEVASMRSRDVYKLLAACVVPRPIALVTTLDASQRVNAAPFSFFNLMGSDPPVVALGVGDRAHGVPKDTARNVRTHGELVVNLVDEALAEAMNACAIDFPAGVDELAMSGLATAPSHAVAVPRVAAAPVSLECRHVSTVEIGRTRIVLAEVVHFAIRDALIDAERLRVDTPGARLVGRMHGSGWYVRTRDLFEIDRVSYAQWLAAHDPADGEDEP